MIAEIKFAINPCPKPRMTQSDRWNTRPATANYWEFKDNLKALWGNRAVPDAMHLIFAIEMPKSWSKKKRLAMAGKPHQSKPDIDNLGKAFMDALLDSDSQIHDIRLTKVWGNSGSITVKSLIN